MTLIRPTKAFHALTSLNASEILGARESRQGVLGWLTFLLCVVVVVASLLLGGGTRSGLQSDAILQLTGIPLLLVSLWRLREVPLTIHMRVGLFFCAAIVAIPILQLIPLPPWFWSMLPGREPIVEALELLDGELRWMPISVSPNETWLSALSLIPPIGVFLGTLLLSYPERRWLSLVFLAIGVVSVFLGFIQVNQGTESPLRFFEITNERDAVGFFANRNHFAALIYSLILFAIVWGFQAIKGWWDRRAEKGNTAYLLGMIGSFTLIVVLLAGEIITRSRTGVALAIVALLGALALGGTERRALSTITPMKLIAGAVAIVAYFSLQFGLYRIMERFVQSGEGRIAMTRNTVEAALAYLPFGSGVGTFVPVYAMFEKPQDAMMNVYVNRAHNDFAELWLTTGLVGPALIAMFVAWLLLRSIEIWRSQPACGPSEFDWTLARSATILVALLTVHSFFDYPLRTGAMMAVMAYACALLIEPPVSVQNIQQRTASAEHASREGPAVVPGAAMSTPATTAEPSVTLSEDLPHAPEPPTAALPEIPPAPQEPVALQQQDGTPAPGHTQSSASREMTAPPKPSADASVGPTSALPVEQRWGVDMEWPEEWSESPKPSRPDRSPDGSEKG